MQFDYKIKISNKYYFLFGFIIFFLYIFHTDLSNEEDEYEYEYQLVQFYNEKKTELLDIDIIPTSWTSWDRKKRACITRYPPPPYTAKVCEQLQQLVECRKPPLQRWPCWTIEIKGGASKLCKYIK